MVALFPGQGAHSYEMFDGIQLDPEFLKYHEVVCDTIGEDLLKNLKKRRDAYLNSNLISSISTVLVSAYSFSQFKKTEECSAVAGYSVGQYTALLASEVISFEQLCQIIFIRSRLMDECLNSLNEPTEMWAVIGLSDQVVNEVCEETSHSGGVVAISNVNTFGQYTISGTSEAVTRALKKLEPLNPKKLVKLPVSGAWHCKILLPAAKEFEEFITSVDFKYPIIPTINNSSAQYSQTDQPYDKKELVEHIYKPVLWQQSMEQLIQDGNSKFIELGFGNMLTKFGMFINRKVKWQTFYSN